MPADDVSDLRDVFDAINRLCETMKTSEYSEPPPEVRNDPVVRSVEILTAEDWDALSSCETDTFDVDSVRACVELTSTFVSAEDISVQRNETDAPWMESQASLASSEVSAPREMWSSPPSSELWAARGSLREGLASPPEEALQEEPGDLYYTASSEVSLLSDTEPERADKEGRVAAGHVAAMRERFESMTRANTPCPELARSASPSLDVFRNITPSPDTLR